MAGTFVVSSRPMFACCTGPAQGQDTLEVVSSFCVHGMPNTMMFFGNTLVWAVPPVRPYQWETVKARVGLGILYQPIPCEIRIDQLGCKTCTNTPAKKGQYTMSVRSKMLFATHRLPRYTVTLLGSRFLATVKPVTLSQLECYKR